MNVQVQQRFTKLNEWAKEQVEGDLNRGLALMTAAEMEWLAEKLYAEIEHGKMQMIHEQEALGLDPR